MVNNNILVSIITVTFNCGDTLIKTIESVNKQKNKSLEFIIIDGESKDVTNEIIEKYRRDIDVLIVEKDDGIYDAMNKGIKIAKGDLIVFLNAGDVLYDELYVETIINHHLSSNSDLYYGDVILKYKDTKVYKEHPSSLSLKYLAVNTICHQAMVFNRNIFEKHGRFNQAEKIYADYEFTLKEYIAQSSISYINKPLAIYDMTGISSNINFINRFINRFKIANKYLNRKSLIKYVLFYFIYKPIDFLKIKGKRHLIK